MTIIFVLLLRGFDIILYKERFSSAGGAECSSEVRK